MLNKFFWWLGNRIRRSTGDELEVEFGHKVVRGGVLGTQIGSHETSLHFTVHHADGGQIVEFSTYDEKRDRTEKHLYIITHDDKLGETLEKIITMETLRK